MQRLPVTPSPDFGQLAADIKQWVRELGFQQVGISDIDLGEHPERFAGWIARGFHAGMDFLANDFGKRTQPATLIPGTQRVITVRMDYWPADTRPWDILRDGSRAYISRYALGRDYHRTVRKRLQKLADKSPSMANAANKPPTAGGNPSSQPIAAVKHTDATKPRQVFALPNNG